MFGTFRNRSLGFFLLGVVLSTPAFAVPDGEQDVTASMANGTNTLVSFVSGFTHANTCGFNMAQDTAAGADGYYYDTVSTTGADFTVNADNSTVATFDLTALSFTNFLATADYSFTITGTKADTSTVQTTFTATGTTFTSGTYTSFTGLTKFRVQFDSTSGNSVSNITFDSFTIAKAAAPTTGPTVTDANISITSTPTGASSTYKVGDTITAQWNNTAGGDNNAGITGVTADFSAFGGGAAVTASNSSETWTASYTLTSGTVDASSLNVSVSATDSSGTTTTADTSNLTADNQAPTVTDANISIAGASGTGGAFKIGDTVTATWNNTAGGDNNADTISSVTVDFSQFGGGSAVAAINSADTWNATFTITEDGGGSIDTTNRNVSVTVTDDASNSTTTTDTTNVTVDNDSPVVSDANISISGATGTAGAFRVGDTVTATWNNTAGGDNNSDTISGVTVNFSQFGGASAVTASNSSGTWSATFTITEDGGGSIDATNRNVSVTATDNAGNTATTADGTNATVDNDSPVVSDANISISGATGTAGAFRVGDTVTATWNNTAGGDNNSDTISGVTVDFSQFGGGSAVTATNSSESWYASYTITEDGGGSIDLTNRNISVTATDDVGNSTTAADTTNATLDNDSPGTPTGTLAVDENSANTTAVGTVSGGGADSVTYSLTDDAGGRFAIDGAGNVTVANGSLLDRETNASHDITVRATDNAGNTTDAVLSVTINDVNEVPTVDLDNSTGGLNYSTNFSAGGSAVTIANTDALVSDVDVGDNIESLTATLTDRPDGDSVESLALNAAATTAATGAGLTVTYTDTTGVLLISGNTTPATYQTILRGIVYNNTDAAPAIITGNRTINVVANDGDGNSITATSTVTVVTAPVIDLGGDGGSADLTGAYSEGDGASLEVAAATVIEPDGDNLNQMVITFTNPLDVGETITLSGGAGAKGANIIATYTSATVITLSGSDTATNYQATLRELQYANTSEAPDTTTRTIEVVGRDVNGNSGATATLSLSMTAVNDAPAFSGLDGAPGYTENGTAVVLDGNVTISDLELDAAADYSGAVLTLSRNGGANANDVFAVITGGFATVTSNTGGTLVVTFGTATAANVATVLQSITYENASDNPASSAQIDWSLSDGNAGAQGTGGALSATGSTTVTITAVNDAPTITGQSALNTAFNTALTVNLADLTVTDPDNSYPTGFSLTLSGGANYTVSGSTITPAVDFAGTLSVPAVVNDGNLDSASFNLTVTVAAPITDADGDGMDDAWELANGLDPSDPNDASGDADGDGVSNLDEFLGTTDPQVDDYPPVVTPPANVTVDAVGLFTAVSTGSATAFDDLDGDLTPTSNAPTHFTPGVHTVTWSATDAAGNTGTATQTVNVNPQVSFSKDQITAEGSTVTFSAILNGDAVTYPVDVPYTVSGTAVTDGSDHTLVDGVATINSGTEVVVSFSTINDGAGEGTENIVVTMGTPTNAVNGPKSTHNIDIVEGNVAPTVSLSADQGLGGTLTVTLVDGTVQVISSVLDPNGADSHSYDWSATDNALIDTDGAADTFSFDPSGLSVGLYTLRLSVSDGSASGEAQISLNVLATAPTLGTADSDGDGSDDQSEGFGDSDGDGVTEYLDAIPASNVLQEQGGQSTRYLIETEPGLSLSLSHIAFQAGNGQAGVSMTDIVNGGGSSDDASSYDYPGGLFDFTVSGLPVAGQSVNVVLAQLAPIPVNALYRKLMPGGWQEFVEDANNALASAAGEDGFCPPPGDAAYTAGLSAGHWCVQLTLEDGGPNDADGVANNTVVDPSGVAQILATDVSVQVSGGGGSVHPLWLALLLLLGVPGVMASIQGRARQ